MDRRIFLRGLINTCPFTEPLESCPIEKLRRLPIEKLIEKMKSQPDYEVIRITQQHVKCKKEREREREIKREREKMTEPEVWVYDKFPV